MQLQGMRMCSSYLGLIWVELAKLQFSVFGLWLSSFFFFFLTGCHGRPHGTNISQFKNCWKLSGRCRQAFVDLFQQCKCSIYRSKHLLRSLISVFRVLSFNYINKRTMQLKSYLTESTGVILSNQLSTEHCEHKFTFRRVVSFWKKNLACLFSEKG